MIGRSCWRHAIVITAVIVAAIGGQSRAASAGPPGNFLATNEQLLAGQSLVGGSGFALKMDLDGDLVLRKDGIRFWSTGTSGNPGARLAMQGDGNLVIYTTTNVAIWQSSTPGQPGNWFVVQGDGNLVVYSSTNVARWASFQPPPPAWKPGVNMAIQQNMYGMQGDLQDFNYEIGPAVLLSLNFRTNPTPAIVTFNEICENSWVDDLWDPYFRTRGYVFAAQWATNGDADCGRFGNVVVVRGTSFIPDPHMFTNRATGQTENKGWVCVSSNLYAITACSAHTTARTSPSGIRQAQLNELRQGITTYINQDRALWVAGDFNLTFAEDPAFSTWWYQSFREADTFNRAAAQKRTTTDANQPIDYIFRRKIPYVSDQAYLYLGSHSDHRWLQMYF